MTAIHVPGRSRPDSTADHADSTDIGGLIRVIRAIRGSSNLSAVARFINIGTARRHCGAPCVCVRMPFILKS